MTPGTLYLVPSPLGDGDIAWVIPEPVKACIERLTYFVVEHPKTARKFLKQMECQLPLQEIKMQVLDEHTPPQDILSLLEPLLAGNDVGLLSEAGCPAVADPGASLVIMAHQKGIKVVPFVGPSSILLALMASGLNGQQFAFNGYLPIDASAKKQAIKQFEKRAQSGQSQSFIETPYRNKQLFSDLIKTCQSQTKLCVAFQLTLPDQSIKTKTIAEWKKTATPDFHKKPCVFVLGS